jgi:hypothetical protein
MDEQRAERAWEVERHRPLRTGRDWLTMAAISFLVANLLHGFDHVRTGTERLTAEVSTGGALITLAALGTAWLAWRRPSRAPVVAAFVGFWSAALVAQAHFAPHWSVLSDSYLDLSPDAFSWFAAAAELAAAVVLGFVGLRQLQADRTAAAPRKPILAMCRAAPRRRSTRSR